MRDLEYKNLKTQAQRLTSDIETMDATLAKLREDSDKVRDKRNKIEAQLQGVHDSMDRLTAEVVVSEHAVLRYLKRQELFDEEEIKEIICPEATKELIRKLGNGKYPIKGGGRAVVKNGVVVTVTK